MLVKFASLSTYTGSIDILLKDGMYSLFQLDSIYEKGSIDAKRQVIGSIYPEKLSFDGEHLRTTRINEAVRIIYAMGKDLPGNEKGQSGIISDLSSQVGMTGFEYFPQIIYIRYINTSVFLNSPVNSSVKFYCVKS